MGQRANLIVVRDGGYDLYYSHWRANTLDRELFWGPEHALAFIRAQRHEEEGAEWLDEVWAEGGAVVDPLRARLRWWGGEDACYDVPRRRLLLELMRAVWSGWDVQWADEGIADLADYVGVPREDVLVDRAPEPHAPEPPAEPAWTDAVLSVHRPDGGLDLYPLAGNAEDRLWRCDELEAELARAEGHADIDLGAWSASFPSGGAHVDLGARTATVWTADVRPALEARLAARNPGWSIRWVRDRFEAQLEATDGRLRFPPADRAQLLAAIRATLFVPDRDHSGTIAEVAARTHPGQRVEINPFALRDDPRPFPPERRGPIWDAACVALSRR